MEKCEGFPDTRHDKGQFDFIAERTNNADFL